MSPWKPQPVQRRGRSCWPLPSFTSFGDRRFCRSEWACAKCRHFSWLGCALCWPVCSSTAGCGSRAWRIPAGASGRESALQGTLIFLIDYGCVFWAEQRVPSGIAAVVLATIAIFITLLEITVLRTQRLTVRLGLALLAGICGVAVLMNRSFSLGEAPIDRAGRSGVAGGGVQLVGGYNSDPAADVACVQTHERGGANAGGGHPTAGTGRADR